MDTKWNSTNTEALPGETVEVLSPETGEKKTAWRAAIAFLAFFLGVCLVLGSLGAALGRMAWSDNGAEVWKNDWQDTQAFRDTVSGYLEDFLTMGAGGELKWYGTAVTQDTSVTYERGDLFSSIDTAILSTTPEASSEYDPNEAQRLRKNPDLYYENDKNVLYRIYVDGEIKYENTHSPAGIYLGSYSFLPEGYNFLLTFRGGRVTIVKDGEQLDVYGDKVYDEDSLWFVPGYENFQAGDDVKSVVVYMAVRETPMRTIQGDYKNGGTVQNNQMYWLYQDFRESRAFYVRQVVFFGVGFLWLAAWFVMRKERQAADKKIASWTVHVWTEARFLAVIWCLAVLVGSSLRNISDWLWDISYWCEYVGSLSAVIRRAFLNNRNFFPALLGLFWAIWLIRNDHRYNPKENRRSLWRLVSVRLPKYPFQKRVTRRNRAAIVLVCLPAIVWLLVLTRSMGVSAYDGLFWFTMIPLCLVAAVTVLALRKNAALARDIGLLADQVEAIRGGDLSTPLDLPADADLRQTAEHLNDIQAGLHKAVAEQTRSERMKVELISNVSHDLKTPLTSILSYAELLRQEPLEGAAADYARVIDEKAQRLKAMVQDVFEVSKAAADQLPVTLERLDFAKLLRQTLADLDDPIRQSGLTFKADLPETPVFITADGKRLYRVFQNLIDNAVKYALPGSRVYLTLTVRENRAEASLRNTSRDELPTGVDFTARFVRGDESRTDGGSGLGLSIAQSFTEACGGAFHVETLADLFTAKVEFPITE